MSLKKLLNMVLLLVTSVASLSVSDNSREEAYYNAITAIDDGLSYIILLRQKTPIITASFNKSLSQSMAEYSGDIKAISDRILPILNISGSKCQSKYNSSQEKIFLKADKQLTNCTTFGLKEILEKNDQMADSNIKNMEGLITKLQNLTINCLGFVTKKGETCDSGEINKAISSIQSEILNNGIQAIAATDGLISLHVSECFSNVLTNSVNTVDTVISNILSCM